MASRYRRGDAVTSAPEGEDFHFHGHTVVKRHLLRDLHLPVVPRCYYLFRLNESHLIIVHCMPAVCCTSPFLSGSVQDRLRDDCSQRLCRRIS